MTTETLGMVCSGADYLQQWLMHCLNNYVVEKWRDASEHYEVLKLGYYYLRDEAHTDYHQPAEKIKENKFKVKLQKYISRY